jgi:hypothetical protein
MSQNSRRSPRLLERLIQERRLEEAAKRKSEIERIRDRIIRGIGLETLETRIKTKYRNIDDFHRESPYLYFGVVAHGMIIVNDYPRLANGNYRVPFASPIKFTNDEMVVFGLAPRCFSFYSRHQYDLPLIEELSNKLLEHEYPTQLFEKESRERGEEESIIPNREREIDDFHKYLLDAERDANKKDLEYLHEKIQHKKNYLKRLETKLKKCSAMTDQVKKLQLSKIIKDSILKTNIEIDINEEEIQSNKMGDYSAQAPYYNPGYEGDVHNLQRHEFNDKYFSFSQDTLTQNRLNGLYDLITGENLIDEIKKFVFTKKYQLEKGREPSAQELETAVHLQSPNANQNGRIKLSEISEFLDLKFPGQKKIITDFTCSSIITPILSPKKPDKHLWIEDMLTLEEPEYRQYKTWGRVQIEKLTQIFDGTDDGTEGEIAAPQLSPQLSPQLAPQLSPQLAPQSSCFGLYCAISGGQGYKNTKRTKRRKRRKNTKRTKRRYK